MASRQPSSLRRSLGSSFIHELCERRCRRPISRKRRRRGRLAPAARDGARHVGEHLGRPDVDAPILRRHRVEERARRHRAPPAPARATAAARRGATPTGTTCRGATRANSVVSPRVPNMRSRRARRWRRGCRPRAPLAARRRHRRRELRVGLGLHARLHQRKILALEPVGRRQRVVRERAGLVAIEIDRHAQLERVAAPRPSRAPAGADKQRIAGDDEERADLAVAPASGSRRRGCPSAATRATGGKLPMRLGRGGRSPPEQARQLART